MMNCKDISRLLDDGEIAALATARRAEAELHVAGCAGCRVQWQVAQRLHGFRAETPPLPTKLRERARQLEEAQAAAAARQVVRRPLIIGSLFLVGATAAMLAGLPVRERHAEVADRAIG